MTVLKHILSVIFNPFTNLFKINSGKTGKFFDKHHFFSLVLSIILVGLIMFIVYYFIYK